jgi:hypothetical protein
MRLPSSIVIVLLLFLSCKDSKTEYTGLNEGWQFSMAGDTIWKPASVPGSVQTDLLHLGESHILLLVIMKIPFSGSLQKTGSIKNTSAYRKMY